MANGNFNFHQVRLKNLDNEKWKGGSGTNDSRSSDGSPVGSEAGISAPRTAFDQKTRVPRLYAGARRLRKSVETKSSLTWLLKDLICFTLPPGCGDPFETKLINCAEMVPQDIGLRGSNQLQNQQRQ